VGQVVATGVGLAAQRLLGQRVAVMVEDGGAFAEFVVVDMSAVIPLPQGIPDEAGASFFTRPMSACAMAGLARGRCKAWPLPDCSPSSGSPSFSALLLLCSPSLLSFPALLRFVHGGETVACRPPKAVTASSSTQQPAAHWAG